MLPKFILHEDYTIINRYDSIKGAKIAYGRKYKKRYPNAVIVTEKEFDENEPIVQVRSLGNGQMVDLRKSLVGTCCDPSREVYWTM